MSGTIFFVCSTSWISRCFPAAIFFEWNSRTPCRRELRKEGQEKSLWWQNQSQQPWYQETWARNNPPRWIRVRHTARRVTGWVGMPISQELKDRCGTESENPTASSQEWQRDDHPFSSTGKRVHGIQHQLFRMKLDHHNLEVSDHLFIEKVFTNVRQKLNRSEDDQILDQRVDVLIWGWLLSTTMKAAIRLGENYNENLLAWRNTTSICWRRCSTSRRSWSWIRITRFWMFSRLSGTLLPEWDSLCYMTKELIGRKQRYMSTQIQFFVWEGCMDVQKPKKSGKISVNISHNPLDTGNCLESMENQLRVEYFPRTYNIKGIQDRITVSQTGSE